MEKATLTHDGNEREFDLLVVQNILNIQHNENIPVHQCWQLPNDSPWQFKNGILSIKPKPDAISRRNQKA